MFTTDLLIDTVQNSKKTFVNTFVTEKTVKESLNTLVDLQTKYAKEMVKLNETVFNSMLEFAKPAK